MYIYYKTTRLGKMCERRNMTIYISLIHLVPRNRTAVDPRATYFLEIILI